MTFVETPVKEPAREAGQDFIRDIVRADLESGRHKAIVTRFPPEPNGYLHIGHAKSICLNFGIAEEFGGHCNLRYDDTNPTKESQEYIDAIERDVRWLGYDWGKNLFHASDYFAQLYAWAEALIGAGKAYVDDQSQDAMRAARGTLTEPGKNSPFRDRSVDENLDLFRRMRAGEFANGARVLRAKIDMASGNINLRDPVLYRILHAEHPRTGKTWSIYPSYDFAHGQSDAIEGITHSLCTLEFEDHRPLYEWFLQNLPVPSLPHQYEFARLNLTYTILSKRVLTELVRGGFVKGWDDPRMPTLAGLRRRGVPPAAIRDFVKRVGVAKANSTVDMAMLEFSIREHLNKTAQRRMAVLRPLKVVLENYPERQSEEVEAVNHPEDATAGTRRIRFGRELFIERDDFMENPPKKFFRLSPGTEVRLRYAYFITCREVVKNAAGEVIELKCTYDPATKGGNAPDGRKVKATMHWVSAADSVPAEVRLYNPLFAKPDPSATDFAADINPNSLEVITDARVEPALAGRNANDAVQFERLGYFCPDTDSTPERLVFNRTVGLRDTWAKVSGGGGGSGGA
jgi:glutaminyl-tRNA synthetase